MGSHGFDHVELLEDGYVLWCECGWHSPADHAAAIVGEAWDEHLAQAA